MGNSVSLTNAPGSCVYVDRSGNAFVVVDPIKDFCQTNIFREALLDQEINAYQRKKKNFVKTKRTKKQNTKSPKASVAVVSNGLREDNIF